MKQTPESFKLYHFTYVTKTNKNQIQNLLSQTVKKKKKVLNWRV